MSHGRSITFLEVDTFRPAIGSMPKEYREVCNTLIDQGWTFVDGGGKAKHKLYPPGSSKSCPHRPLSVPRTPSSHGSFLALVSKARQYGAQIDMKGQSTVPETVRTPSETPAMPVAVESDITPITTHGAWWRPSVAEPEPAPEPAPAAPPRRYAPRPLTPRAPSSIDPDAEGTAFTLGQARSLLKQGYHLNKVIAKTGWGRNWLSDLADESGYAKV